jgi:mRNA-degrading endonuclease RelE of RelBE toxin-antitoxin system
VTSQPGDSSGWEIRYTRQAEKDIADLRPHAARVRATIQLLRDNPMRGHPLSGNLAGVRALEFRVPGQRAAYRAAYAINAERQRVVVFAVGPHESFYEMAARRAAGSQAWQLLSENE